MDERYCVTRTTEELTTETRYGVYHQDGAIREIAKLKCVEVYEWVFFCDCGRVFLDKEPHSICVACSKHQHSETSPLGSTSLNIDAE